MNKVIYIDIFCVSAVGHVVGKRHFCESVLFYITLRYVLIDSDPRPPPIIYHGPQNQTLPTDGSAVLPCLASGEPAPNIIWLKGRSPLNTHDRRVHVAESGSLEISGTARLLIDNDL